MEFLKSRLQVRDEEYSSKRSRGICKNSDQLMNKFIAKSIQGTAYPAGKDEIKEKKGDDEEYLVFQSFFHFYFH